MPCSTRFHIFSSLAATVLCTTVSLTVPLRATDFPHFDQMNIEAQAEYIAVMIDATENALRTENAAAGDQMHKLFTDVLPGDSMPLGLLEYEENESRARRYDAERHAKDHAAAGSGARAVPDDSTYHTQ